MRNRWFRLAQYALGLLVLILVVRTLARDWENLRSAELVLDLQWPWLGLSVMTTWLMYAGLIEGWRGLLIGWGQRLSWSTAARIWVLASFGKYLPGRVWAIAGMMVMSERAGVKGTVRLPGSVVMQVLAVGSGVAVAAVAVGRLLEEQRPGAMLLLGVLAVMALVGVLMVASSRVLRILWKWAGREGTPPAPPPTAAMVKGMLFNLVAWLGYGVAFWALAHGLLADVELSLGLATGAFVASYLAGILAIFAPAGLGVREGLQIVLLEGAIGYGPAIALAAASRIVLTLTELGAAAPFLLLRETPRDIA